MLDFVLDLQDKALVCKHPTVQVGQESQGLVAEHQLARLLWAHVAHPFL